MTRKIVEVTPYIFGDALIFALSKNWIDQFNGIPKFDVTLDNKGRLTIQSIQKTKLGILN